VGEWWGMGGTAREKRASKSNTAKRMGETTTNEAEDCTKVPLANQLQACGLSPAVSLKPKT
jgi:hypothetical protein